ncbi:MAG: DHA2 family efflux MFS transporter permease subunit [Cytophagales bacterium]|nr:DHA2 family efflux MFS transporter permease subunit [Armatimonadota bacterium]
MATAIATSGPGTRPAGSTAAVDKSTQYRWLILAGLVTAAVMEVLDTTIINVALPTMGGNLGATNTEIAWVSTGYILSNVVVLPMTAFLAGRFGRKRYLSFSILVFILSSFFCGTSRTLGEIVFWRVVQGAGGAALLSTAQATLRQIFPKEQQGIVQSIFLVGIIMAPTLGPTLGGYLTDNYTWNWCFFINVPIGIISLLLVTSFLQDSDTPLTKGSVDWLGIGLLAVGLGSLQYVLEEGNQDDWFESATIVRLTILSVACLIAMVFWELWPGNKSPIVNFRILKNKELTASLFLFIALGFGLYGGIYLFPVFSQSILGFTPTETGLTLLPGGLMTAVSAILCGRLLGGKKPLVDPRLLIVLGVGLFMLSMWDLGHLTTQSGIPDTRLALMVRGFALGFLFTPINLAAFSSLKPSEIQQGSGLINLTRQLGGSFGIAILGTYVQNQTVFHKNIIGSYLYAGDPAVQERLQSIARNLVAHGYSPAAAQNLALGQLNATVTRQAATMSYNDAFLMILIAFLLTLPAVFLLRPPKPGAAAGGDAH